MSGSCLRICGSGASVTRLALFFPSGVLCSERARAGFGPFLEETVLSCMLGVVTCNTRGELSPHRGPYWAVGWDRESKLRGQEQIHKNMELTLKGEKENLCDTGTDGY